MADVDRLSNLPDSLLSIIISFLPFEDAARTSVLAKRWLHVWHSTQNINFDEAFFLPKSIEEEEEKLNPRIGFVNFVTQFIQRYEEPIARNFRLVFSQPKDYVTQMEHFIKFAIDHKVKLLILDFSDPSWSQGSKMALRSPTYLQLPFYEDHESLEYLKLFYCYINVKLFKNFPLLKTISLGWITLNDNSIKTLVSKCPMLEDLSLNNICQVGDIEIIAPRLMNLVIKNCSKLESAFVHAPLLKCFAYAGEFIEFQFVGLHSLVEAYFDFGLEKDYDEDNGYVMYYIFNDITCIRSLSVCSYVLQVISSAVNPLLPDPVLPNVQSLTLKTVLSTNEFYGITFFLKHCPSLESLLIQIGNRKVFPQYDPPYSYEDHPFFATNSRVTPYDCVKNTLKVVHMKGCEGKRNELLVLNYLLKYGAVLERIYVGVSKGMESTLDQIIQNLMHCDIASPNVVLVPFVE